MVKLCFALRRLPHLSLGEFQRYWLWIAQEHEIVGGKVD